MEPKDTIHKASGERWIVHPVEPKEIRLHDQSNPSYKTGTLIGISYYQTYPPNGPIKFSRFIVQLPPEAKYSRSLFPDGILYMFNHNVVGVEYEEYPVPEIYQSNKGVDSEL